MYIVAALVEPGLCVLLLSGQPASRQAALLYETQHLGSIALFGERVGLPEAKDGFCS